MDVSQATNDMFSQYVCIQSLLDCFVPRNDESCFTSLRACEAIQKNRIGDSRIRGNDEDIGCVEVLSACRQCFGFALQKKR